MPRPVTVVAEPRWVVVAGWLLAPPLGAGAGWLLVAGAGRLDEVPWGPARVLFRLIGDLPARPAAVGALLLGALAGAALAVMITVDRLVVTVSPGRLDTRRGDTVHRIDRDRISAVFRDGEALVVLGTADEELLRERADLPDGELERALLAHGYPWRADGDPFRGRFRRWVPDSPGLPPGADAYLAARQRALEKGNRDDVMELRTELTRLGVVVRDEGRRQYWRPAPVPTDPVPTDPVPTDPVPTDPE